MIKKQKFILILLCFVISCTKTLPHAAGQRDEVTVVVPPMEESLGLLLSPYIEKEHFLPSSEKVYYLNIVGAERFSTYKLWRNVIIIGYTGTFIDTLLSENAKKEMKEGAVFHEKNLFVEGQTVILIAAENKVSISKLIQNYGETIYNILREDEKERIQKLLFLDGEQVKISAEMMRLIGASFRVPLGYKVSVKERNIYSLIRHYPDRLVTIFYEPSERMRDPIKMRDSIFTIYFEGDSVLKSYTKIDTIDFQGVPALRIIGVWQNQEKVMGGPFISYIFIKNKTLYFLDGHIFSPQFKKWPYLEEVDIILKTFITEI